jgi:hypothetical protein
MKGWFGLHRPEIYSDMFTTNVTTESDYNRIIALWRKDIGSIEPIDIVTAKLNYMFKLSNNAYVTSDKKSEFSVRLDGGSGQLLIRSAMPEYEKLSNESHTFITSEENVATCNENFANIVSDNNKGYLAASGVHYSFNKFYGNDSGITAGNYFAGFSNNANIIQTDEASCELDEEGKPYQTIPYKTDAITSMCLNKVENVMKSEATSQHGDYKKYFRAEFIDRRFDYDATIITGHKCNHFGISDFESNETSDATVWDKARFYAHTYNGIEMLYKGDDKLIVSSGNDTEYKYEVFHDTESDTYSITSSTLSSNTDSAKRFYDSKLLFGNNKYVELIDAYRYYNNTNSKAYYLNDEGTEVLLSRINHDVSRKQFYNFGFYNNEVYGYPSERYLDYYRIPYSDRYTFINVSCGYDGIEASNNSNDVVSAYAAPGETVTFTVDANEIISIIPVEFSQDKYNVEFTGNGHYTASTLKELRFRIIPDYVAEGFKSKTKSVHLYKDDTSHSELISLKTSAIIPNNLGGAITNSVNEYDTSESFKDKVHTMSGGISGAKTLFFAVDRVFESQANDNLKKAIRVINTSTILYVNEFNFRYSSSGTVIYNSLIPEGSIEVDVNAGVNGNPGHITVDDVNYNVQGSDLSVNTTAYNENDSQAQMTKEYCVFEFSNAAFLVNCLSDLRFKITINGVTANYTVGNGIEVLSSSGSTIRVKVLLSQHNSSISNGVTVNAYLKVSNGIKSADGDGYMVFMFKYNF